MHDSIKDSELVPVEKAGHGCYYEEKEKVNAELMRFICQISLFVGVLV
jgi:non-heme chloroperoxidase